MQDLGLLVAYRISLKRNRRFHGYQAEELHNVVRNHIAQCASGIEISTTLFHADGFRIRDLDVVNVAAVPDWLKDRVIKPEDHDVLYRLFAERSEERRVGKECRSRWSQ